MASCCLFSRISRFFDTIQQDRLWFLLLLAVLAYGAFHLISKATQWLLCLYRLLVTRSHLQKYHRPGSWAVITGATDGIGLAFAIELYQRGWNILIISRNQAKLDTVIQDHFSLKTNKVQALSMDFSKGGGGETESQFSILADQIKDKDIGLLVNNVGISYDFPEFFDLLSESKLKDIIRANIESTLLVTHAILPQMICQKRGLVLSLSSGSSILPTSPLLSVYAASKAFINYWSQCMNEEYRNKNIFFETITPFYIATKMSKIRHPSLSTPAPITYVKSVIKTIGNYPLHTGYSIHQLLLGFLNFIPLPIINRVVFNIHASIRAKALKRKEKNQ